MCCHHVLNLHSGQLVPHSWPGRRLETQMVVNLFEGLQRPANGTAISLKFDTSHMDNFLEKLLHGATHAAPLPLPLDGTCPTRRVVQSQQAHHRSLPAAVKATDDEVKMLREDNKRLNDEVAVLGSSVCTL